MRHFEHLKSRLPLPEAPASEWDAYTDLALEQQTLLRREAGKSRLEGVDCLVRARRDIHTTTVKVTNEAGSAALGKPMGTYVTLETDPDRLRTEKDRSRFVRALAGELAELMGLEPMAPVLAVGLGNDRVAYDALGPRTAAGLWITRHLGDRLPEALGPVRPVSAVCPGVLGQTGVEAADLVRGLLDRLEAACVVVIDALAARNRSALGATVQLTDTGLCPGSGILAGRPGLDRETLGVPVYAIGVPMLSTLAGTEDFLVIPRAVEARTAWFAEVIARGLNLALHPQLSESRLEGVVGRPGNCFM